MGSLVNLNEYFSRKIEASGSSRGSGISTPPGSSKSGTPVRKKKTNITVNKSGTSKLMSSIPTLVNK